MSSASRSIRTRSGSSACRSATVSGLIPDFGGQEPLAAECRHFVECVLGKAATINGGREALRVVTAPGGRRPLNSRELGCRGGRRSIAARPGGARGRLPCGKRRPGDPVVSPVHHNFRESNSMVIPLVASCGSTSRFARKSMRPSRKCWMPVASFSALRCDEFERAFAGLLRGISLRRRGQRH